MLASFGLFAYGVLSLFTLSALLAATRFRLSRRSVLTRLFGLLVLASGAAALGWRDHQGTLTAAQAWMASALALLVVLFSAWLERRRAG